MNYKSIPTETDAEIIGCGILTCMSIVSPLILFRFIKLVLLKNLNCLHGVQAGAQLANCKRGEMESTEAWGLRGRGPPENFLQ